MSRLETTFINSAAILLFTAALVALLGACGDSELLNHADPLLFVKYRVFLCLLAAVQIAAAVFLTAGKNTMAKLLLVAWLAATVTTYRVGAALMNEPSILSCLGNLITALPIHPRTLGLLISAVLGCLVLGACGVMAAHWLKRSKAASA